MYKLPRAAFGVCFQSIQSSKLIKHAKKGEEVRSRTNQFYPGTKLLTPTFHPDWPCALALRAQTGPYHHLKEKKVCKHSLLGSLWKRWGRLACGKFWDCDHLPQKLPPLMSMSQPYLATSRVPGLPCLHPPCPARRAPGALLASDYALSSHVHPFIKTKSRYAMVPGCL